ncbi:MAG: cytochrome c [Chloroflexi bacterium]|nr:cytochrome c [Chloroflexota bacterium]MCI0577833.1 cytochrome c [Chloroflexota bacterium]MCI0646130.1 cytochrome c [Chloroflexota bacterium]MCI0731332.1 cytochrome c [Chloroflexota bacterium]
MTRRLLPFFLLFLALAACGGNGEEPTPASEPAGNESGGEGGDSGSAGGDATAGQTLFQQSCSACHGPDGKGLPNLGKDLTTSDFAKSQSDQELLAFVKQGRPASDPANTTGVDMPPKGGNPALSDEQILDIIAYVRTLEE